MSKTLDEKMNEMPQDRQKKIKQIYIEMVESEEHEDGSATYKFDVSPDVAAILADIGLKALTYCGICNVTVDQMFECLWTAYKLERTDENVD